MHTLPFDVNDAGIRREFLTHLLPEAIEDLAEESQPLWGTMTARHMVEHLIWAFEASRGEIEFEREIPEARRERLRAFLHGNQPTPIEFRNPVLGAEPHPFRFAGLDEAKTALREEMERFFDYFRMNPDAVHTHSVFGPLNADEWERSHYKHCWHHLLQFGLVREE